MNAIAGLDAVKQPVKMVLNCLNVGHHSLKNILATTMHQSQR
jgi:hypothetical protein